MVSNKIKRCLSLVMALALTFSLLPLGVTAEEAGDTQSADGTAAAAETASETTVSVEEPITAPAKDAERNPTLDSIQAKMNGILEYYLGTADPTAEEVPALVAGLNPYDTAAAEREIYELEYSDEFQSLSEADIQQLTESNASFMAFAEAVSEKASHENAISTYATTVGVLDDQVTVTDSLGNGSVSNGTVTVKASGGLLSQKTNTITITNKSGSTATVSFDYSASNYSSFSESSASGTISMILENEGTITMTIKGKKALSSNTATLTLSNFSITAVKEASNVTFNFDSNYGSVTAAGSAITSGSPIEVSLSEGVALVATPTNGATFYGWVNAETGVIMSTDASYTLIAGNDLVVEAVFVGTSSSKGYWSVAGATEKTFKNGFLNFTSNTYYQVSTTPSYLFDDLNKAASCASNTSSKYIVPLNNCTLAAGDYEIPSGVTLLIPFDSSNTLYTTVAQSTGTTTNSSGNTIPVYETPSAYRTLTLAAGANLKVNGALSISGKHCLTTASSYHGSSPSGKVGFINMAEGSSITVNGSLYAYGYITGSGTVTANSGASVYELFQIADFRGGSQTTKMENKVFPLSQYYIQNIEVPLVLNYGATEYCYTTIYMSSTEFGSAPVLIGADQGMFAMHSGNTLTKRYDGSKDRLYVETSGPISLKSVSLTMNNITVNSSDYVLPINNNISVTIKNGSSVSISEDIAMLPGSQVIIEQGANVSLASGKSLYIYDADQWSTFCGSANKTYMPLSYVPGRTYSRQASDIVDAMLQVDGTLDTSAGNLYTTAGTPALSGTLDYTGGGANICSTGTGQVIITAAENTNTYQLVQGTGYYMIPVTSAQLKNGDGKSPTYTSTSSASEATTYHYINGRWHRMVEADGAFYPALDIVATNIAVNDGLDVNFYVNTVDMVEGIDYTAVVVKHFAQPLPGVVNQRVEKTYLSGAWTSPIGRSDLKGFRFDDVSAKEMTDDIEVRIYVNYDTENPVQVSSTYTESVQKYAIRTFADVADESGDKIVALRTALADMLYYGAEAQNYFEYNTGNLATASDAESFASYLECSTKEAKPITNSQTYNYDKFAGSTISATNTLMVTFYFDIPTQNGYSAIVTYTDHYNEPHTLEIDGPSFYERNAGKRYGVDVLEMSIVDGRSLITCKLYDCDLETVKATTPDPIAIVTDSVESYAARVTDKAVFAEMMQFVDSAAAYFDLVNKENVS